MKNVLVFLEHGRGLAILQPGSRIVKMVAGSKKKNKSGQEEKGILQTQAQGVWQTWQLFPGITQTSCPFEAQLGHRTPGI